MKNNEELEMFRPIKSFRYMCIMYIASICPLHLPTLFNRIHIGKFDPSTELRMQSIQSLLLVTLIPYGTLVAPILSQLGGTGH